MSAVKVERRHREAAVSVIPSEARSAAIVDLVQTGAHAEFFREVFGVQAQVIARVEKEARAEGYAACQEDVVKTARRFARNPGAELLGAFADDVENGIHVGASSDGRP